MGTPQTVPMFAPDGSLGDIPYERMAEARKAGAMPAITMRAPDGSTGLIPVNRMQEAAKAGGTVLPFKDQEAQHPGFWHSLWSDLAGSVTGLAHSMTTDPLADPSVSDAEKSKIVAQQQSDAAARASQRTKEHGVLYSLGATANELLGVNVAGEEQAAKEGNPQAVAGHAVAGAAPYVVGAAATAAIPATALKARALYDALPSDIQKDLIGVGSPRLRQAIRVWDGLKELRKASSPELDATGENRAYAGEPQPRALSWNAHDATGENKPFAGGMDEQFQQPARKLSDLSGVQKQASALGNVPAAKPAPGAAGSMATPVALSANLQTREQILARLSAVAKEIEADEKSTPKTEQHEEDLTELLLESLKKVRGATQ